MPAVTTIEKSPAKATGNGSDINSHNESNSPTKGNAKTNADNNNNNNNNNNKTSTGSLAPTNGTDRIFSASDHRVMASVVFNKKQPTTADIKEITDFLDLIAAESISDFEFCDGSETIQSVEIPTSSKIRGLNRQRLRKLMDYLSVPGTELPATLSQSQVECELATRVKTKEKEQLDSKSADNTVKLQQSLVNGGTYILGPPIDRQFLQKQPGIDNELLRGVKRHLEHIQQLERPTPTDTPASLGHKLICELKDNHLFSQHNSSNCLDQPAVLETSQLESLGSLTNEHQVVAFMTPVFEQLLGDKSNIRVVNSEEYPWLRTSSESTRFNQKPDCIFCHSAIYQSRPPFNTEDAALLRLRRSGNNYGILAAWGLRDCIDVIGEAKMEIDDGSFGEVVNYARHICYRNDAPRHSKLLLYDKQQFWLIRVTKGEIASVVTCRWDAAGGKQILKAFIKDGRSPWIKLLITACDHWNLDAQSNSFLGKGTYGRVFKVTSRKEGGRKHFLGLKIVLPGADGSGGLDLAREQESLTKAAAIGGVARVEGFQDFGDAGAALLLADVGIEVPKRSWRQLFATLGRLHQRNIVHGDPRLGNAILVHGSVKWIDFRTTLVATRTPSLEQKKRDLRILVKSCCDKEHFDLTVAEEAMEQYDGTEAAALRVPDTFLFMVNCA